MAETRRRIAAAAVELHGSVGPARTTMTAVANRAGVQRHTVYRHFPTEAELFGACSAHFFTQHPLPEIEPWQAIADPHRRLQQALNELFAYYESTAPMFRNVLRDAELLEDLRPTLRPMQEYLEAVVEVLARGWGAKGRRQAILAAALHHAIDFQAWRSLTRDPGTARSEAIELVIALVEAAAAPRSRGTT